MTPEARKTLGACASMMGLQFDPTVKARNGLHVVHPEASCQSQLALWNPLDCVSDAAEMAIKLDIDVVWNFLRPASVYAVAYNGGLQLTEEALVKHHKTKQAAYCYAMCKVVEQLYRSSRDGT